MKRETLLFLLVLLCATLLRLWKLGVVPDGITHDELGYVYNAYSISQTGKNVFGEFLPFLTWLNKGGFPFLPVPIYLSVPFFWLFGLSTTVGRLPAALLGIGDIVLLYLLVKQLFKKTSLALLASLFLAISPWHIHFSRTAYDPSYALFFYLAGIVSYLFEMRRQRLPVLTTIAFLLAIFSYRGMNAIFLPLFISLLLYAVYVLRIKKRLLIGSLVSMGIVIACFISVVVIYGKPYIAEALNSGGQKMQEEIDQQSREARGPLWLKRLFLNKPNYMLFRFRENYLKAYSPEYFFLYTEPSQIYSIWSRGRVYSLDLFFIIFGFVALYKISKSGFYFTVSMVLIGGLPGLVGGMPYSARNLFVSVFLPVLTAGGVLFFYQLPMLRKRRYVLTGVVVVLYGYLVAGYLFDYYARYAYYARESWVGSLKDMSSILLDNQYKQKKFIIGRTSFGDLMQFAFYARVRPSLVQSAWKERKTSAAEIVNYKINNAVFTSNCPTLTSTAQDTIFILSPDCSKYATPSGRIKDFYGNTVWKIYEK